MAKVVITPRFVAESAQITSDKLFDRVWADVFNLEFVPTMGSEEHVPESVKERYREHVRTIPIAPFLVVYVYDEEEDECWVLGLMPQKQAY